MGRSRCWARTQCSPPSWPSPASLHQASLAILATLPARAIAAYLGTLLHLDNNEQICRICHRQPFVVLNAAQPREALARPRMAVLGLA